MPLQNTPFAVAGDHAGLDTTGYRLFVNGALVEQKPVAALAAGKIKFTHPGLPRGNYTVEVAAYNVDGEAKSTPANLLGITGTAPAAPTNIQITVI